MKVWELDAVCRDKREVFELVLGKPEWTEFGEIYLRFDELCASQDRGQLDRLLPEGLVEEVLKHHGGCVFLDGNQLRSHRVNESDSQVSYLEVYQRFGGSALEDILEKGSVAVERAMGMKAMIENT